MRKRRCCCVAMQHCCSSATTSRVYSTWTQPITSLHLAWFVYCMHCTFCVSRWCVGQDGRTDVTTAQLVFEIRNALLRIVEADLTSATTDNRLMLGIQFKAATLFMFCIPLFYPTQAAQLALLHHVLQRYHTIQRIDALFDVVLGFVASHYPQLDTLFQPQVKPLYDCVRATVVPGMIP